jgi:hypothetical protein
MTVIGTVRKLDMLLQCMNYKANLADLERGWGRNKKFHAIGKKFSANTLFNRR